MKGMGEYLLMAHYIRVVKLGEAGPQFLSAGI